MRTRDALAWLVLAGAVAAGPARADAVLLSDGRVLQGKVLETTADGIRMALENGTEVLVPVEFVSPGSFYAYRRAALADGDLAGRLGLADYCLGEGLLAEAEALVAKVGATDPSFAPEVERFRQRIDERKAELALERAREARVAGDLEQALELVKKVLIEHEDTAAAQAAEAELDEIVARLEEERRRAVERRLAGGAPGAGGPAAAPGAPAAPEDRARIDRILAYVDRLVERARAAYEAGLAWDGQGVVNKANDAYEDSIEAYRLALQGLGHAARRSTAPETRAEIEARAAAIRRALVESYLAPAYLHAAQRNWKAASRFVDGALAVDPAHEYALRLRERISQEYIRRSAFQQAIGQAHQRAAGGR